MEIERIQWVWKPNELSIHKVERTNKIGNTKYIKTRCKEMIPICSLEDGSLQEERYKKDPICPRCRDDIEVISKYD